MLAASKAWNKRKKNHRKCHFRMIAYVKDQQGRILLEKHTTEAGEGVGVFKAP